MPEKILILSGSPKKNGNTETLISWFCQGAKVEKAGTEVIRLNTLKFKVNGCSSCRMCQKQKEYGCTIKDDANAVLLKMSGADVLVFATPLYFFSTSAQTKIIMDRMFSLYKWDNKANAMETILKGKKMVLLASAYEDIGLEALEVPFKLTADYTGMDFESLLIKNAGVSGDIVKLSGVKEKVVEFGRKIAG
ncbi:MAG: hypothetical protein A2252_02380 [Elusimicrobia bacterium RIFOXYA2_FULL_39_19]|nr:MAG: hypothetical protein A2252_02380 [Elusimicrobia bacterium RIFOXYA2_FULL_39_19]